MSSCSAALANCVNVTSDTLTFEGKLSHHIFPGPPNYEDVTKGDTPEPTYIVTLDSPICVIGDDMLDPKTSFDTIQIFPDRSVPADQIWTALRQLVGQRVTVNGKSAFGAITGHHHAPLLLPIKSVSMAPN